MGARGLDFLIIGAVKGGTTSLHEYLLTHPALYLPAGKEHDFFSRDEAYARGWDPFSSRIFHHAAESQLCGKASPRYLGGPMSWHESTIREADAPAHIVTARRIAKLFPDVKLIVMLRDPVERAVSAYWETVRWGWKGHTFESVVAEWLEPEALRAARAYPGVGPAGVIAGEYGRLLAGWLEVFPRSQLFIGSMHVLASDPEELMRDLYRFLGVDDSHRAPNLGTRYNTRTYGRRVEALRPDRVADAMLRIPGMRRFAWAVPPAVHRRATGFLYRVNAWNRADGQAPPAEPDPLALERLRRHFEPDLDRLRELVGAVPGVTSGDPVPSAA